MDVIVLYIDKDTSRQSIMLNECCSHKEIYSSTFDLLSPVSRC